MSSFNTIPWCIELNESGVSLFFPGIEGVVSAYQQCLPQVKLYGPTSFSPIINHVASFARQAMQQNTASVSGPASWGPYFWVWLPMAVLFTDMRSFIGWNRALEATLAVSSKFLAIASTVCLCCFCQIAVVGKCGFEWVYFCQEVNPQNCSETPSNKEVTYLNMSIYSHGNNFWPWVVRGNTWTKGCDVHGYMDCYCAVIDMHFICLPGL